MEWDDLLNNFKEILAVLIIGGSWVFGLVYRAFRQKPQKPQAPQPPRVGPPPPAEPRPVGHHDPVPPRNEVRDFLDNLRRQAEAAAQQQEAARPQQGRALVVEEEEDEWIPVEFEEENPVFGPFVEPGRQAPPLRSPPSPIGPPAPATAFADEAPAHPAPPVVEGSTSGPMSAGFYYPPGELHLPNWMTLEELRNVSGGDKILGIPVRNAILINEILARPRALRPLRPGSNALSGPSGLTGA